MKLSNISLPYPVLGICDDILPELDDNSIKVKNITPSNDSNNYSFEFELSFENDEIKEYIKKGFAEYTCEVDCVQTVFRQSHPFPNNKFTITIPRKSVYGRVDFNCFVSVKKPIHNYSNPNFNEDYYGFSFDLQPGDVLVGFPQKHIDTDIKYDKLHAAGSFMEIVKGPQSQRETKFNFEEQKIQIVLPEDLYNLCEGNSLAKKYGIVMQSSLAYNALTCALYEISSLPTTLKWVRVISTRLHTEDDLKEFLVNEDEDGIQVERVPELAMRILKDPYNRLINYLSDKVENDNQNDNE